MAVCCLIIFSFIPNFSSAQSSNVVDAYAAIDPSGTNQRATFNIEVSDTNDISQIEIKLGGREGVSDLLSQVLDYDVTTGLPSGFSYSRTRNKIIIISNVFSDVSTYFGSVRVKNNSGVWSDDFKFITN